MEEMIKNSIQKGVYAETEDNTLRDLKRFRDFLYRNFKNNEHYNKMYPTSNQPAQLYGTAKTHKHENIDEINVQSLNFRPIIAQTGTGTYNAAQVISNYLKPLYTCNEYITGNRYDFSKQSPLLNSLLKYRYLQNIKIPRSLVKSWQNTVDKAMKLRKLGFSI